MKQITTVQEDKSLFKIDSINVKKETCHIIDNPIKFFEPYLKNINGSTATIFAYFSIFVILQKIDTSEELCTKTADYFLARYSIDEWLDKLTKFYEYTIFIITHLVENHDNSVLDAYNKKQITQNMMKNIMQSFIGAKKQLTENKEATTELLTCIEKEKERIKDFLD